MNHFHNANALTSYQNQNRLAVSDPSLFVTERNSNLSVSRFWVTLFPMIYFFVQHKVHRIPGGMIFI